MAATHNLSIDQGVTYSLEVTVTNDDGSPVDLSDAIIRSQIRKSPQSTIAYPFTITKVDGVNGVILFSLSATEAAAMTAGTYVYDAEYQIDDIVVRFIKGMVVVNPSVTK